MLFLIRNWSSIAAVIGTVLGAIGTVLGLS